MARSNKSADPYLGLNEPDPYVSINGDEPDAPRNKKAPPSDDAAALKAITSAMQAIVKQIGSMATQPPEVNITQKTPKKLRFRVTDRDEMGRIKDITVTVLE